ncbi:MAG: hypothetical protein HOH95_14800 [Dehalococcoidia bacterium]|jgi:hypothetical protein|nr:hypothetical protein [Dehalococcoidia bacterium]
MVQPAELEQQIIDALGDADQLSKKDFNKIMDVDGGLMASALRSLVRAGRVHSGSDGSTRVYRLIQPGT